MATAGFGFSANTDPIMAVKEAIDAAGVPGATFALVSCTVDNDVAAVNDAFVSELPDAQLQGVTSCGNILMAGGAVPGVGCLLFDAPGSFVTAYGEDGGAAAADLKQNKNVLEGTPQAIIMATTPGNEEAAMEQIGIEYPGTRIYGGTAADNALDGSWKVLTGGGAKDGGVALVAVMDGVKFGASMLDGREMYTPTDTLATVTKVTGETGSLTGGREVLEIDYKPALDTLEGWYGVGTGERRRYLVENPPELRRMTAAIPLCTKNQRYRGADIEYLPVHCSTLDPEGRSASFFAPLMPGQQVWRRRRRPRLLTPPPLPPLPPLTRRAALASQIVLMDAGDGPATGYAASLSKAYDAASTIELGLGRTDTIENPIAGVLIYCGGMSIAVGDNLDAGLSDAAFLERVEGLPLLGITAFGEQAPMKAGPTSNKQRNLSVGMLLFE